MMLRAICQRHPDNCQRTYESTIARVPMAQPTWPEGSIKAAAALYMGATIAIAARAAGVPERNVRHWRNQPWWPACQRHVEDHHLQLMAGTARSVIQRILDTGLSDDATARDRKVAFDAAKFVLERRDEAFAPVGATHQHLHATLPVAANLQALSVEELRALAAAPMAALPELPEADEDVRTGVTHAEAYHSTRVDPPPPQRPTARLVKQPDGSYELEHIDRLFATPAGGDGAEGTGEA